MLTNQVEIVMLILISSTCRSSSTDNQKMTWSKTNNGSLPCKHSCWQLRL